MADLSKITLPSGSTYDIKDKTARDLIAALGTPTKYLGVTTTALTDGSSASPITIGGESITPTAGNIVGYGNSEFVWSDIESKWREFGSTGSLKALAFKDDATGTATPSGDVSKPTFTGSEGNISASYTPAGTVSTPEITVTLNTATVKPFGSAGKLPSCTLPKMTATVSGETLSLGWSDGSFNAGELPSAGTDVSVAQSVKSASSTQPTFTGTAGTATGKFTPSGEVSKPTFTGAEITVTVQ